MTRGAWNITPHLDYGDGGVLKEIDVTVKGPLTPAEAMRFALALLATANSGVTLTNIRKEEAP